MKKPTKTTSCFRSELMSKSGPLEGEKEKPCSWVPGEATGEQGFVVPSQLAMWTVWLLRRINRSPVKLHSRNMANAILMSAMVELDSSRRRSAFRARLAIILGRTLAA